MGSDEPTTTSPTARFKSGRQFAPVHAAQPSLLAAKNVEGARLGMHWVVTRLAEVIVLLRGWLNPNRQAPWHRRSVFSSTSIIFAYGPLITNTTPSSS